MNAKACAFFNRIRKIILLFLILCFSKITFLRIFNRIAPTPPIYLNKCVYMNI